MSFLSATRIRVVGRARSGSRRLVVMTTIGGIVVAAMVTAPTAQATQPLAVSASTTTYVAPNATTVINGLAVSNDPTDTLQVTISTNVGTISMSTTTNLTLAYNNSWSGTNSITFTGSQSDINTGLATAALTPGSTSGSTATVGISAMVTDSTHVYYAPNQHFYQYVASSGVSWTDADTAAKALSFDGQPGYLATIATSGVNSFLSSKIQGATNVWFGARATTNVTANGTTYPRAWRWATGTGESPIAGRVFSYCDSNSGTCSLSNNTGLYSSWASGEPNNSNGTEDSPVTNWNGTSGQWNDLPPSGTTSIAGYVVEFGDRETGSSGFTGVAQAQSSVAIATAPGAPTSVTATRGNASASVAFTAPSSNGSAITSYLATSSPGGYTATCTTSPCAVTGLTNGTAYTFTVTATNVAGTGPASAASAAVTPATVPGAPTIGSATAGNATATVTFTAPTATGGSAITGYTAISSPGNVTGTCSSSPCTVNGLSNGTAYTFTVQASNAVGAGAASTASNSVTPMTVPGAPTSVVATRGNASASVAFTAPASTGGSPITGYTATSSPTGVTGTCSTSPCTVTGLTNGTAYTFTVTATNAVGTGPASAASAAVTPATVPGAPTIGSATAGNATATVTFTAPTATGGSAITGYTATSSPGNVTGTCSSSPCTVNGLSNGTAYTFTVQASNAVGAGAASTASNSVTPMTVPGAPTSVVATRGNASASVAFTAPASTGGSPITGYTATSSPTGVTGTCSTSPCAVTGLTNGTAYTFTVTATNAVGTGSASAASTAVTPATVPGAPTIGSATAGNGTASVTFTAPAGTGGSAVTGYTATSTPDGVTGTCSTSPCTVNGLSNGTAYTFTVQASNAVGAGAASTASNSVTPMTVPGAPTSVVATRGNASASVAFTAPASTGGSPITNYAAISSPGGYTANCANSPCLVTGLTNGTAYTFTVTATNAVGASTPSAASNSVTPATVPGAPTIGSATAGNGTASVTFTAPAGTGGSAVTGYTATSTPGGYTGNCANSPCLVTGLSNGTTYTFTVQASNAVGAGTASAASNSVTPVTVPDAPTSVVATRGNTSATVAFTAPSNNGSAITSYRATSSPGGYTATCTTSPCTVTGLTNGTAYTFTVTATNAVGTGPASAASTAVTPATTPGAPTIGAATAGNASTTVTFTAPTSNGGAAVTNYAVISSPGGLTGNCANSPCLVTGLSNGTTYTFTVTATNAVGASTPSAASNSVTPITVPDAPTSVTATRGNTSATVAFTAPSNNGGAAIAGYIVTTHPGGASTSCTLSPCTITGLSNGTDYTFTVQATNSAGSGTASQASNTITPATVPDAPAIGSVTAHDSSVTVTFTAPADNGGSVVTTYTVTSTPDGIAHTCSGSPCTVSGLTNGTAYTFTVQATNAVGTGDASVASDPATPVTVPDAPTSVIATRGNTSASVAFTTPDNGGSPITGYTVTSSPGGLTGACSTSPCVVTGLTNGTDYTFTVTATNAVGAGDASTASNSVTPATVPGSPTISSATGHNGSATVTFTAPTDSGGTDVTGYTVTSTPDSVHAHCNDSPCTITGLSNGTTYTFTVRATNAAGTGLASDDSDPVTPATTPGAPTGVTATPHDSSAAVSFSDSISTGGAPVSGYVVTTHPGGATKNCTSSPCTINGLTNGTEYTFTVQAINVAGPGPASSASDAVTPATVPDAPTIGSATADDTTASVTFTAPDDDGGSDVTGYTVTSDPDGVTGTCTSSPCVVNGLTNGVDYTFTATATNVAGTSDPSDATNTVTPATTPGAPTDVTATRSNSSAHVSFADPTDTGGAPITGYVVTTHPGGNATPCTAGPCTVTGLVNGTDYTFTVQAINRVGTGPASDGSNTVTPATVPDAPTDATATGHDGSATVTFTAPDNGGSAISGYTVTSAPGGRTGTCSTSPCLVDGLTNGVAYTFTVTATNGAGTSDPSTASGSITPAAVPDAPTGVTATRSDAAAEVSFTSPADPSGAPVTGYTVTTHPGNGTTPCVASPCSVHGLTNGTSYTFTVQAVNRVGPGPSSPASNSVTPAGTPGAPTNLQAARTGTSMTLTWTAPDSGGTPITDYTATVTPTTVTPDSLTRASRTPAVRTLAARTVTGHSPAIDSPAGITHTCPGSPCPVTGLDRTTTYTVSVHANNAVGAGPESVQVAASPPTAVPGVPRNVSAVSGNSSLALQFSEPTDDGASAISGYAFSLDNGQTWHALSTSTTDPLTAQLTGLVNGTTYSVVVHAANAVGAGPASSPVSATPATVPDPPMNTAATVTGSKVTVTWDPPTDNGGAPITGYTVIAMPGGATCTTSGATRCTFPDLPPGRTYRFSVVATNASGAGDATGTGTGSGSAPSRPVKPAPVRPGPLTIKAVPGDRKLVVTVALPHTAGTVPISRYRVSLDGGHAWTTMTMTGAKGHRGVIRGVDNGRRYHVQVRAVHARGADQFSNKVVVTTAQWFSDPLTRRERDHEHAVPSDPANYHGPVTTTTAADRAHDGTPAYPGEALHGRKLQHGEAASVGGENAFRFDSATLTADGKRQIRQMISSLRYVHAVTCQGFADYGGANRHELALSRQRARAVCNQLRQDGATLHIRVRGYGARLPVVIGGSPADRAANRRVVVMVNE